MTLLGVCSCTDNDVMEPVVSNTESDMEVLGILQMYVDELHQTDDFPDYNKSKNSFCPFLGYMEAFAEPSGDVQRITTQTCLLFWH